MELLNKMKPLEIKECPFANLPEKKAGRWGAGLTAAKMTECRWLKPVLVGQFEYVECTGCASGVHHRSIRHTQTVPPAPALAIDIRSFSRPSIQHPIGRRSSPASSRTGTPLFPAA